MKHIVTDTVSAAAGHWPRPLPALGISINAAGKHSPCPVCGGKDRFRFDNKGGRGTWVCNRCGGGDGLALVVKALDVNTKEAASRVADLMGTLPVKLVQTSTEKTDEEKARAHLNAAKEAARLIAGAKVQAGNAYLTGKGLADLSALTLTTSKRISDTTCQPGDLLVPMTDFTGETVNAQLINADGVKRTLAGGQVKGAFHRLGEPGDTLWLTEGYATGLTVHRLTGQAVYVALSANNLPALAERLHAEYPEARILIAADNDENGTGQLRAEAAAKRCNGKPALPPVTGDWNDVFQTEGEMTTQAMLTAFTQPKALSPFESVSEADLKAMNASQKAELLAAHYLNTLAVPVVGEDLCRYEGGAWQVLPYRVLSREIAALFQKVRAPFSATGIGGIVDTLKLMVPQMGAPARRLIGFRNGAFDTATGIFGPHKKEHWLRTINSVDYTTPKAGENLADDAPRFWQWLTRAAGCNEAKQERILAALFMVLANRYDWQLFLEVTGPGGSGKSVMASIGRLLAGEDNTTAATIDTLESSRERAAVVGYSLIILPDQEKWSGDGAGIKAITGGDAVAIDPKYRDAYSTHIPAVILAVNNNPMRFSDRSGGVSRRRVILPFPDVIPVNPRRYLYHAYLSFMEARGHQHPMSLTAFGQAVPQTLKEYEIELLKRKTKNGIQTSLELSEDCEADWLPRCDA